MELWREGGLARLAMLAAFDGFVMLLILLAADHLTRR